MPSRPAAVLSLAIATAAALSACGDDAATAPESPTVVTAATTTTTTTTAGDTARPNPQPATGAPTQSPADTARPTSFPAAVRVHGRVLVASPGAAPAPGDTVGFAPVAGARITLYRNQLVDGKGVSQRIGEVTTGADGQYAFDGVPGGYYVLALNATADRPWGENVTYVLGNAAVVRADMRFWRMPTAPTGGSTTPPDSSRGR